MRRSVELEAARRAFLAAGSSAVPAAVVRPEVLASWERSRPLDPDRLAPPFRGHRGADRAVGECAEDVFAEFLDGATAEVALVLLDADGVVRVRRDGGPALGLLLDALLLVPGYGHGEHDVGTTAAAVALHEQADVALRGPEHYHVQLGGLAGAAARVLDPHVHRPAGVVLVVGADEAGTVLHLPVARSLARQIADRLAGQPHRRTQAVLERLRRHDGDGLWALATDGERVVTGPALRQLDGPDQRQLADLALSGLALREFGRRHLDLPGAGCAEIALDPIEAGTELIGCVLAGRPAGATTDELPEAVRRQGSHVAPLHRRDYAEDLRRAEAARAEHAEARIRANRDLLSPFPRARHEITASVAQGRHHLLVGEPGVGKRTLALEVFRRAHPAGRVVTLDCARLERAGVDPLAHLHAGLDERPHLLLLHGLHLLGPVAARRLDESLRPLVALPVAPLVVGCVDAPVVDATRPYGLLLRHFHETTRVPPLRYRADELTDIAWAILRRLSARRSLRLSLQVVRVLEGYAWPGNISELEDVLRYVVARKPLGEIQPPDLPPLCFQGRARRLSMLEAAQCDAIIQALYESRGNRYQAAAMLGIARSSLYRKIDAFGISYIA